MEPIARVENPCILAHPFSPLSQLPPAWDRAWEGPESPTEYCRSVVRRAVAVEAWWGAAKSGALLSGAPLDLSDLFHPGTFLNALRQFSARQLGVPLDMLKLASCWDAGRVSGPGMVQVRRGLGILGGCLICHTRLTRLPL